jgi:5-methyltetrahydrofolate--homocysteine methyltransferase
MDKECPPGALSYPGGVILFGPGEPILCVNDQCGYYYERPEVLAELHRGRFDSLIRLAQDGVDWGFPVFNVQLMEPSLIDKERELVPRAVEEIYAATGCCIAVDSRDPNTVDRALAVYPHKAMCNSVNGELENLETMLPVIAKHGAAIGTALVYEKGIPQTVEERLFVARRIVEAAEDHGIPRQDVMIDAVCLPSGVVPDSMRVTLQTIRAIHEDLEVPTLLGVSNAGYMMPNPRVIDLAYFIASASWGLDVAMIDPFTPHLAWLRPAVDFLMGTDPYAREYLDYFRANRNRTDGDSELEIGGHNRAL